MFTVNFMYVLYYTGGAHANDMFSVLVEIINLFHLCVCCIIHGFVQNKQVFESVANL